MRTAALVSASLFLGGCSFVMVDKAPKREVWDKTEYSACSSSSSAPVLDTIGATIWGAAFLFTNVGAIIFAAPLTASAYYGHTETNACDEFGKYRLAQGAKPASVGASAAKPSDGDVMAKAKRCQTKGGVWINDMCRVELEEPASPGP